MLAYRHAFHAGNHADVLKHAVQVALLRHLNAKDKGWRLVDTHAGAGLYQLNAPQAQKRLEFVDGIGRLWGSGGLPPLLSDYIAQVRDCNGGAGELTRYPGSPLISQQLAREQDQLRLFELHPTDAPLLSQLFDGDRRVEIKKADGFAALKAQLPPPTRRGLVFMDPSYEIKTDYQAVKVACEEVMRRFGEGMIAVWYPQLVLRESQQLPVRLKVLAREHARKGWLHVRLTVGEPGPDGFGMFGSGMFIFNPPHTLGAALRESLPLLVERLGQGRGAAQLLEMDLK